MAKGSVAAGILATGIAVAGHQVPVVGPLLLTGGVVFLAVSWFNKPS